MKLILILAVLLLLLSCYHKPTREEIADGRYEYFTVQRINSMLPPVIIQSIGEEAYGWDGKRKLYAILVKDASGKLYTLDGGPEFSTYKAGDKLR